MGGAAGGGGPLPAQPPLDGAVSPKGDGVLLLCVSPIPVSSNGVAGGMEFESALREREQSTSQIKSNRQ